MKKIILLIVFTMIYGCGYTSVLKNQNQQDIKISIKNIEGDFQTNNFIKNQIKLSSNPSSSKNFDVNILSKYDKIIIAKDSAGVATDYKINISLNITILSKNNIKINYNDSINIKNNSENFEQIEYEREIKKNFASDVKDKLILYLLSLDDS
jgi:outer membrane lipopolysaccharide assembly protein LptE/RlpB